MTLQLGVRRESDFEEMDEMRKANLKRPPLIDLIFGFSKWELAKTYQLLGLALSVAFGGAFLLAGESATSVLRSIPLGPTLPIISDWIKQISGIYRELAGLNSVLQFASLTTISVVLVNLIVAVPELKHRPRRRPLEDARTVVDRWLHCRLYHRVFCLHFDSCTRRVAPDGKEQSTLQSDGPSIADLVAANLDRTPALAHIFIAIMLYLYFMIGGEAGVIDIYRPLVFVGYPLMIFIAGLLATEMSIYFFALIFSSLN